MQQTLSDASQLDVEVKGKGEMPQRLLIGFSKSGNGALLLILRHPTVFSGAAIWDAPAQLNELSAYGALRLNFGNQENFDHYNIPSLLSSSGEAFRHQNRLWISGDQAIFTADMTRLHNELTATSILHTWAQGATREHNWHSGWLNNALIGLDATEPLPPPDGSKAAMGRKARRPSRMLALSNP